LLSFIPLEQVGLQRFGVKPCIHEGFAAGAVRHANCNGVGMINVIIAEHQRIFRIGLAITLASEDDIRIVGQPQSLAQLIKGLEKFRTHVLVLSSAYLGSMDEIKRAAIGRQTAILLLAENDDVVLQKTSDEVQGVIQRSASESTFVRCIRQLARGGKFVCLANQSSCIGRDLTGNRVRRRLSQLELKIIASVVKGCKNREIAYQMGATEHGIKNALRRIFDKTGVFDRLELALFVLHHQVLPLTVSDLRPVLLTNPVPAMRSDREPGRRLPVR
jgi:DNA-binding NarL/FixJ family response regulator